LQKIRSYLPRIIGGIADEEEEKKEPAID